MDKSPEKETREARNPNTEIKAIKTHDRDQQPQMNVCQVNDQGDHHP
jgi:hypothetical protein